MSNNWGRALAVTLALMAFLVALAALDPPLWLKLVAVLVAVAATWRYWWIVNRRLFRLAWARRKDDLRKMREERRRRRSL